MSRLTICVPYRDRADHLRQFVPYILRHVDCRIVVIEQEPGKQFNRGKLVNVGWRLFGHSELFCIHDVDMLPVKADYYHAPDKIVHLATQVQQFKYRMPYGGYFGGVNILPSAIFGQINGFYNDFWGWGAEDDDLLRRCSGLEIVRPQGRFLSLHHKHALSVPGSREFHRANVETLKTADPNNGVHTCQFEVLQRLDLDTHTIVRVAI